jgi:glycosyltransferase involved in cell wall biosynthesis
VKILLIGEFSRLHNSLKEGLTTLGHDVILIGNGDGFKNYPVDVSTKAQWCESKWLQLPRKAIHKITEFDIATIEFGIRFYFHLKKLKNFDVVQLINESAIQTVPFLERYLLKKIIQQNNKLFLLCCGVDYTVAKYMMEKKGKYSIMNPYFENPESHKEYQFIFNFLSNSHKKTHDLVYANCRGIIASDIDYVLPMQGHPKFLGLIPNPINTKKIEFITSNLDGKIQIFLGINSGTYYAKGISYFEKVLEIIKTKYASKIEICIVESIPYNEYIQLYNKAHIVLDQVYAYDQGYNALEAMAKGKVVFTGAEKEFIDYYKLDEKVAINALPDVAYLVAELSFLIENPNEIITIGKRARQFIEKEHQYTKIAEKYLEVWKK